MRCKDLLFSLAVFLFMLGSITANIMVCLDCPLPDRVSGENGNYLTGETPASFPAFSLKNFECGEVQKEIERAIEDSIPFRADAMVANAAIERSFIMLSNAAFQFPCYPSFFGSDYLVVPDQSRIYQKPLERTDDLDAGFANFIKEVNEYGTEAPKIRIVVYVAPCARDISPFNPANRLMSNAYTPDDVYAMIDDANNNAPENVTFVSSEYDSFEQWDDGFYKYDHHWNIKGAASAVRRICEILGIDYCLEDEFVQLEDVLFCGSQARESLDVKTECVFDMPLNYFDNLQVSGKDQACRTGSNHYTFERAEPAKKLFDFHELYFGDLHGATITGGHGSENILLIGDSFCNTPARLLAQSSKTLYLFPDLYNGRTSEKTLKDRLSDQNVSTIVMIARFEDYAVFQQHNAQYLK